MVFPFWEKVNDRFILTCKTVAGGCVAVRVDVRIEGAVLDFVQTTSKNRHAAPASGKIRV
jgi:hypothetical protein